MIRATTTASKMIRPSAVAAAQRRCFSVPLDLLSMAQDQAHREAGARTISLARSYRQQADSFMIQQRLVETREKLRLAVVSDADQTLDEATVDIWQHPESAQAHLRRGLVHELLHNSESALFDLTKAISLDPSNPMAWYCRGVLRAELGETDDALEDLARCLQLDPSHVPAFTQRERLLRSLGREETKVGC